MSRSTRSRTRRRRRRPPGRGRGSAAVLVSLAVVLALVGGAAWAGTSVLGDLFAPPPDYEGKGAGAVVVQVESGDTLSDVGVRLEEKRVVKSVDAFLAEAEDEPDATFLQPGYYELRKRMSASSALTRILDPESKVEGRVVVPEGSRMSEIVGLLANEEKIARPDVVAALADDESLGLPEYAKGHPEGYLFPATYVVDPGTRAKGLVRQMVARFEEAAGSVSLEARARELGVTPAEAVVVASLVQAEARHAEDFGKVARVVYNRLEKNMPLQFDSTVNYALDADKTTVTLQDLQADSPYNTYQHKGLPPTPINSPGEDALEAALDPPKGPWLYFVTVDDKGTTKFTADYQQFLQFKAELKRNRGG
jgi:UPF0755 protein